MTLICFDHSQSPTHKKTSSFLQDGNSIPVNGNNANLNQNHLRRNSCSPTLIKAAAQQQSEVLKCLEVAAAVAASPTRKLERSVSEPLQDSKQRVQAAAASNTSRYKTELCRPYEESGTCKYGDKCQFAHGSKELRTMARHPKYKTELCRTFHSTGLCPYGPRCHFIHNSEQTKKNLLNNLTGSSSPIRPKALGSLGSSGEISPPSSHGGTPTAIKSFDDLFHPAPAISLAQEFANLANQQQQQFVDYPVRADFNPDLFAGDALSLPDTAVDNYSYQNNGPVIDLYQTGSPLDLNVNANCIRLPIFDLFHK